MIVRDSNESNPFNLEFENRPEYLYVYVSGEQDNLEIKRQIWKAIEIENQRRRRKKMLVVEDIKEAASMIETYQIAVEISEMDFINVAIAFVDLHLEQHELNKFGEDVGTNRGIRGRVFSRIEDGEKWLLEN